ncbi:unnamed protein product, partial [Owenia fusiformis]
DMYNTTSIIADEIQSTLGPMIDANHTRIYNNTTSITADEIQELWVHFIIAIFLISFITVGNSLILWTVYKIESIRSVTSLFIVNLSLVDFLTGAIVLPITMTINYIIPLFTGNYVQNKYYCIVKAFLLTLFLLLSVFGLIGIAIERYIAIVFPLRYVSLMTVKNAKIIIVSIWVYVLSMMLVIFINDLNVYETGQQCINDNVIEQSYYLFIKLNIFVPILIIFVVYTKIAWVAYKHRAQIISELASIDNARAVAYKNEHSIMKATIIVNVVFMIMYGQFL